MKRALATTLGIVALAVPATAAADSIVYVKERNVWIANPDGSGNRQVTFDGQEYGSYESPTQSDNGTIWAARGDEIVKLDQQGTVLARWDPAPSIDSASQPIDGVPQDLAVSPDGRRLVYVYYSYGCPVGVSCGSRTTAVFSYADRLTQPDELGYEFSFRNPQWVDNENVLGFNGYGRMVAWDRPGTGKYDAVHWFDDPGNEDLGDGELSPQGDRLAALRSYGENLHLQIFKVESRTQLPTPACSTGAEETLGDPTWSPDGKRIAFEHAEGIEVLPLPNVVAGDCPGAGSGKVVIPGGKQPDWGPADVQPRYELNAELPAGTRLAKALKRGLKFRIDVNVAGTLAGVLRVGKAKVAAGSATLRPGDGAITFRFTKKARKKFARRKKLTVLVDLTFRPQAGASFPVRGPVVVKR